MDKEKLTKIFSIVTGIVFLVSGFSKIFNTTGFADLIDSYGLEWTSGLSPAIVVVEIVVGLLLVLGVHLRRVSVFAIFLLTTFTIAYGYGHFAHGVENCGCFGSVDKIKMPFWVVFVRNAFLIYFMVETFRKTIIEPVSVKWKPIVVCLTTFFAAFIAGFTYHPRPKSFASTEHVMINKSISDFPELLNEFFSSDSSYLVYVFSYSCPHCWNSIENLKQYENLPIIDRLVGITPEDTTNSALFRKYFNPQFSIRELPTTIVESLVAGYPTSFYIKNDSVRHIIEGELPHSYFFQKNIEYLEIK